MPAKKLPEIIVFAGPNGSRKSTITRLAKIMENFTFMSPVFHRDYGLNTIIMQNSP